MVLTAGALAARLAFWQVMQHGSLSAMATQERQVLLTEAPLRGQILDANGNPLASDVTMDQVYAVPKHMGDPAGTARAIAPILGESARHLEKLFSLYSGYVLLALQVSPSVSDSLKRLKLPGIVLRPVIGRDYPENAIASQVLGFVGADGKGEAGLEAYYNSQLAGTAGVGSVLKDTAGNDIRISNDPSSPAQNGADVHLSLDGVVQSLAETQLQKAVAQHDADGGSIVVMDPKTGYILAMAGLPTYNPNVYSQVLRTQQYVFRNPVVEWTYEPGSTFKILTMAAGLDSGSVVPQSAFDDTGQFKVADVTIHNWCMCGFGWEDMTQVLQHSANVGVAWVASRMKTSTWYHYLKAFGMGRPTGIDLADEQSGQIPTPGQKIWTIVNKYTNAYGQGLTTTPIQLLRAVAAVANGGILMKPQLVTSITYRGHRIRRHPVSQGRAISARTAHTLTAMLVQSAIGGEASRALVKGYDIAAKTGTANVAAPGGGGYVPGVTIGSIIAWAPAYNPRFIALVILNHPRDSEYGSIVAAPVIHTLFQELLLYYHVPPSPNALNQ
jgi:cell division protein FtsI/penicillin-binding protein 2